LFDFLVDLLGLAICLQMIGSGSCDFDFQELAEAMHEIQYELGSLLTNNFFWESVELPDMVSEQLSHSRCHNVVSMA